MNPIQEESSPLDIITSIIDDIIIKIEKDNELVKHIQRLPSDITRYIYEEYIEAQLIYESLVSAIDDVRSERLDPVLIRPLIPIILSKPKYIAICRRIPEFNIVYIEHKIRNKKSFKLMCNGNSFATAILFYCYH